MGIMDSLLGGMKSLVDSTGESMVDTARRNSREANDTQLKKAQDKLKTLLGVFSYDETDEKQVYLSFPNFREKI